jgi:SAM-dependent methyltransferase
MHFERMAAEYAGSRPPYPRTLYEVLEDEGVIGPGTRVLEVGAGSGLATRDVVRAGSEVVAVEPGHELARLLERDVPGVPVLRTDLERAYLPRGHFDSAVAATSLHWVDLSVGLPALHATLRPGGWLAVWRHRFGDDSVTTDFRRCVEQIVAQRMGNSATQRRADDRPTMSELTTGGWFEGVRTEQWRWSMELRTDQVRRLFRTFSDWSESEVEAAARAADSLGGVVTEHYRTVLHLLRRAADRRA